MRHVATTRWSTRRHFPQSTRDAIEQAIGECESRHGGEIRFVVETAFDLPELWRKLAPRTRALQLFEIVADRGIASRVPQAEWDAVCKQMQHHYREGRFREGSVVGILGVGALLGRHFPGTRPSENELPNQPVLL